MSITIEKAGVLDTLQDTGRVGFAHLGVNPNGPMDWQSHQLANALVGNALHETIIESHFPAPIVRVNTACIMAFTGGDFHAQLHGKYLPINKTLFIPADSIIQFTKKVSGERVYIAVCGGFDVEKVMGSTATNMKASFGGWQGRALRTGDELIIKTQLSNKLNHLKIMPWFVYPNREQANTIRVLQGPEWEWISTESKDNILQALFTIQPQSDRMAILLKGNSISLQQKVELISTPVLMGTLQLLPSGQMLVLMADHQTVGGYPRVLQVIKADLPKLAQMHTGAVFNFQMIGILEAQQLLSKMNKELLQITSAVAYQLLQF